MMRKALSELGVWCAEWSVKVNVEKCGIMHMRKKGVKRSGQKFTMNGEAMQNVTEYKYLGCIINEHVESKVMVDSRAKAGARALSAWLKRCSLSVGEVKGESFVRLLEALVESVLLYGAEVWGCCRQIGPLEQVQMRAARIFLGVGRLHPRVALQYEMMMLPLVWVARRRCIEFWLKVMRMEDKRVIKLVALEAQEAQGKVKWLEDLKCSWRKFGWTDEVGENLEGLSVNEVGQMLNDCAWREVKKGWVTEAAERSKLSVVQSLIEGGCKSRCVQVGEKGLRRILAKLRGGTAELRVESGRWVGLKREERICSQCGSGEVEDVEHFLLRCGGLEGEREELEKRMEEMDGEFADRSDKEKVVLVMEEACSDRRTGRAVQRMWAKRFL